MSPILNEDNTSTGYLIIREDITQRRKQEEQIRFQAHFDSITKLPNRVLSKDRLQMMISQSQRQKTGVGV